MTPAHNGPQSDSKGGRFVFHEGGRLATITIERADRLPRAQVGGGKRGKILGFSKASRRRLMRRVSAVNRYAYDRPPSFLTLTYPREYPSDPTVYRSHARAFLKRLRRRYPSVAVVWRLEFQRRGAPHFHMLCFDLAATEDNAELCRRLWVDVVDAGDWRHAEHGTDLGEMRSWSRVTAYLSKYIAKRASDDGEILEPVGRWWGVEGAAYLRNDPVPLVLRLREAIKLRRTLQRFAGRKGVSGQGDRGYSAFLGDDAAIRLALHHGAHFDKSASPKVLNPDLDHRFKPVLQGAGYDWRMGRHMMVSAVLRAVNEMRLGGWTQLQMCML